MDSKAIRLIVTFGVIGTLLLAVMMMFTLDQTTDTHTPQIAGDIAAEFRPSLAEEPPAAVKLTMTREPGPPVRRWYTLRLRPAPEISRVPASLTTLMYDASKLCALEIGEAPGEVRIRCIAELPDGTAKEASWVRDDKGVETGIGVLKELGPADGAGPAPETPKR